MYPLAWLAHTCRLVRLRCMHSHGAYSIIPMRILVLRAAELLASAPFYYILLVHKVRMNCSTYVLDKGVHKPFKQYLREESMAFMLRNPEGTKPTRQDIALWIKKSWDQIQPSTILNTWESIGIRATDH